MMIHPARGPGVCERARWRICLKPCVVIRPTRAPFDSSTAFVATVVPCRMLRISPTPTPASSQMRCTPASTPSDGSARGRRRLHAVLRRPALVVHEVEVGERPADVHPKPVRHLRSPLFSRPPAQTCRPDRPDPRAARPSAALEPLRDADQRVEVDPRLDPLAVQQVDEVLRGDVPGRARRERAAADPSERRVQLTVAPASTAADRVRIPRVARVVQVCADRYPESRRRRTRARGPELGTPTPIVSASTIASGPASANVPAISTTRRGSTRPSNGQPKDVPIVTVAIRPSS